ncbi:UNVERIFIED_CONTAM: cytochrome [Sesamum angustifolium]|uniref:Cytochrome n=1 Tax=Sesamum angustifolium TaxID=2727405 RepID=A0AAW2PV46_9LAMI
MDAWFIIIVSLCILALVKFIFSLFPAWINSKKQLPPGPLSLPLIGNLIWFRKPISDLEFILRRLKPRYGPLITLRIAHRSFIFIGSHSLAHHALVHNGAIFSDRPAPPPTSKILNRSRKQLAPPPTAPRGVSSAATSPTRSSIPPASGRTPAPAAGSFLFSSTVSGILPNWNLRSG